MPAPGRNEPSAPEVASIAKHPEGESHSSFLAARGLFLCMIRPLFCLGTRQTLDVAVKEAHDRVVRM